MILSTSISVSQGAPNQRQIGPPVPATEQAVDGPHAQPGASSSATRQIPYERGKSGGMVGGGRHVTTVACARRAISASSTLRAWSPSRASRSRIHSNVATSPATPRVGGCCSSHSQLLSVQVKAGDFDLRWQQVAGFQIDHRLRHVDTRLLRCPDRASIDCRCRDFTDL
jgi:hypothetical protein